ncbi:MAG: hypothetical protein ACRDJK_03760, partial [Actinomycetota bacterium]
MKPIKHLLRVIIMAVLVLSLSAFLAPSAFATTGSGHHDHRSFDDDHCAKCAKCDSDHCAKCAKCDSDQCKDHCAKCDSDQCK